jgi:two-component system CheB/CheR fusion protein
MTDENSNKGRAGKEKTRSKAVRKPRKPEGNGQLPHTQTSLDTDTPTPSLDAGLQVCPVVGVGASARGLEAFKALLHAVPPSSGLAFVLIQHLDPDHESMMVELLSRTTGMKVLQITDGMPVQPNHVYVIPPKAFVTLRGQTLHLASPSEPRGLRMPIDIFFRSLAEERGKDAICIVLSGTGTDGTRGLQAVKQQGGRAIVQDPETAGYDGMPKSAIATGLVDEVCPPEDMAHYLLGASEPPGPDLARARPLVAMPDAEQIDPVLALLKVRLNFDFSYYKKTTLVRRAERRMGMLNVSDMAGYLGILREDDDELKALFKDLLISVTSFFRDPETMQELSEKVVPELVYRVSGDRPLRIWIPGCATGEEAYSIAILFVEGFRAAGITPSYQIFATDVDKEALEVGRNGTYSDSIRADVTPERLNRFFTQDGQTFRVNNELRENVVFAAQNLIADPPFSRMDLISCRNLLIYLTPQIQKKIIPLFSFALRTDGYLCLGTSETVGRYGDLFRQIGKKIRIYQKIRAAGQNLLSFPVSSDDGFSSAALAHGAELQSRSVSHEDLVHRTLLDVFAPAAVLIDQNMTVQYFHGRTHAYLSQPVGEPTRNLLDLAGPVLRGSIRALVAKAVQTGAIAASAAVRLTAESGPGRRLKITAIPLRNNAEGSLVVTFEDIARAVTSVPVFEGKPMDNAGILQQLEYELKTTREDLQSTIEELETSNEELKASNEEVMSMNEELQSTNEELETSKEELQSVNEELSTVNVQLQEKLNELEATNNDFANLLASTDMATIFLDLDLCIKRYTPATQHLFNVISSDIGRPLTDISFNVDDPGLVADIRRVMDNLVPMEREVRAVTIGSAQAEWYWRRVLPYRTHDNKIAGTVITYAKITDPVRSREILVASEAGLQAAERLARLGSWTYDLETDTAVFSPELRRIFGLGSDQIPGDIASILAVIEPDDRRRLRKIAETALNTGAPCDTQFLIHLPNDTAKVIHARVEAVTATEGHGRRIRGTVHDITDRTRSRES